MSDLMSVKDWISVKERLPPLRKNTSISDLMFCYSSFDNSYHIATYNYYDRKWKERFAAKQVMVTHWMQLIDPPRQD